MFSFHVSGADVENPQQNPMACFMQNQQLIITIPLARKPLECFALAILSGELCCSPSKNEHICSQWSGCPILQQII